MKSMLLFISLLLSFSSFAAQKISVKEAYSAVQAGEILLFDVRELTELKQDGKAMGAEFFPKSSIDKEDKFYQEKLATLPKGKVLTFYCRSGKRSEVVADKLAALGFSTRNMGAFQDWVDAGYPVSSDVP